jgi:threonine dehydratase
MGIVSRYQKSMRIVSASAPAGLPGASLPSAVQLDLARDLAVRFPEARLRPTTLLRAPDLDARADPTGGTRVYVALESLQVTGSFKVRGALMALARLRGTAKRAIAASAGNHGAGVAYASKVLGVPATVVVPEVAPRAKREKIASYGARIVVVPSPHYDDAEDHARELAKNDGGAFVSAYDDLDVVAGNGASLGFDIQRARGANAPSVVLAPFGGGGLCTGLAVALERSRVWGVQTEASPAMARSLEDGHALVRLTEGLPTLAEGLEGGIAEAAFARARATVAGVAVVSEDDIARAMAFAFRDLGVVVEGSAAVALVPLLRGLPAPMRGGDVVCVLTGRNVDRERLDRVLASTVS